MKVMNFIKVIILILRGHTRRSCEWFSRNPLPPRPSGSSSYSFIWRVSTPRSSLAICTLSSIACALTVSIFLLLWFLHRMPLGCLVTSLACPILASISSSQLHHQLSSLLSIYKTLCFSRSYYLTESRSALQDLGILLRSFVLCTFHIFSHGEDFIHSPIVWARLSVVFLNILLIYAWVYLDCTFFPLRNKLSIYANSSYNMFSVFDRYCHKPWCFSTMHGLHYFFHLWSGYVFVFCNTIVSCPSSNSF